MGLLSCMSTPIPGEAIHRARGWQPRHRRSAPALVHLLPRARGGSAASRAEPNNRWQGRGESRAARQRGRLAWQRWRVPSEAWEQRVGRRKDLSLLRWDRSKLQNVIYRNPPPPSLHHLHLNFKGLHPSLYHLHHIQFQVLLNSGSAMSEAYVNFFFNSSNAIKFQLIYSGLKPNLSMVTRKNGLGYFQFNIR